MRSSTAHQMSGPREKNRNEGGGEGNGADALAVGFLVLEDAKGGENDAARLVANGAIAVSLIAGERRDQVLASFRTCHWGRIRAWPLGTHTASRRRMDLRSSLGLMAAMPR